MPRRCAGQPVQGPPRGRGLPRPKTPALQEPPHKEGASADATHFQLATVGAIGVLVTNRGEPATGFVLSRIQAVRAHHIERDAALQLGPQLLQPQRSDQVALVRVATMTKRPPSVNAAVASATSARTSSGSWW